MKNTSIYYSMAIKEESARNRIKKRLNNYTNLKRERQQIAEERERILARLGPGAQNLDGMPRNQGAGDALANGVAAAADLLTLYEAKAAELDRAQADIEALIETLEPVERMLARFRYIDGHTWEEVCVDMAYSWRQVHRIHGRLLDRLVAAALGLGGEAGECLDIVKKALFQGHELDREHLIEELGDVAWYLAIFCDALSVSLEEVLQANIAKLRERYPDGFDKARSVNRTEG